MVFSSTVFLFLFLPIVLTGYYLIPISRLRNIFLLGCSLFFYAWGEGIYIVLMLVSIGMNYSGTLILTGYRGHARARFVLVLLICANLLLLGAFKYANFAADNVNVIFGSLHVPQLALPVIHLPIGISFFTFQAMSYVIDVYRNDAKVQYNPLDCGLYIALFPQLIAGPIVRYHDIADQLTERFHTLERFTSGVKPFTLGLGKKMLIANPMGLIADQIFALPHAELSAPLAWSGVAAYTLQIFFDFSGYSDMAIGLGRLFGFEFPINFNYPYIARSFRDFWRRWHISLSSWFRDYLYIPLGGNRLGPYRTCCNLFLVFFLCGLWHGANWNFIIWGMMHGIFMVLERGAWGRILATLWLPVRHLYVMLGVMVGWVIFRSNDLDSAISYLNAMFGLAAASVDLQPLGLYWSRYTVVVFVIGVGLCLPLYPLVEKGILMIGRKREGWIQSLLSMTNIVVIIAILLASAMELAVATHNPFIYFRF